MPPSTADAPITTSAHFIQTQIVNGVLNEQPGDSTAPTGTDKLLKPEGGHNRGENLKIKKCSHWYMGGLTTVPMDMLHFKLLITFWILLITFWIKKKKHYCVHYKCFNRYEFFM